MEVMFQHDLKEVQGIKEKSKKGEEKELFNKEKKPCKELEAGVSLWGWKGRDISLSGEEQVIRG